MENQQQVLPAGSERKTGRDAQRINFYVAKVVSDIVKTTLGPKGMDKMLVDSMGDTVVTNDGATILRDMQADHPTAKMMIEIARTQDVEVGDGTTTAVVLAGELLKNAEDLIDLKIHPTVIAKGYRIACDTALKSLEMMSVEIEEGEIIYKEISKTAMTGKGAEDNKEFLSEMVVSALGMAKREDIKIEAITGGSMIDSQLVNGIVLDKLKAHPNMPDAVHDAKIALLDIAVDVKTLEMDTKINIDSPDQIQQFSDAESEMISNQVNKIVESGANVVISSKNICDAALHFLSKDGILCVMRCNREDLEKLTKVTNGKMITNLDSLGEKELGHADTVGEHHIGDKKLTFVTKSEDSESVTLLLTASTTHLVEEIKRAVEDSIGVVDSVMKNKKIVGGAGSCEMNLHRVLSEEANHHSGREQLAIQAFANAMEIIPKCLAENAGLDLIDVMAELRSEHKDGFNWKGINVFTGKVMDAFDENVIEPLKVKTQALLSATEVAIMILRIDDIISTNLNPNAPPEAYQQQQMQ